MNQTRHKIIFYRTEAIKVEFEVLFEDETFWLTQKRWVNFLEWRQTP